MSTLITRGQRAQALFLEPEFFDDLCEKVAEGGTLAAICKDKGIPFGMTYSWIKGDESRTERYDTAVEARDAYLRDRVIDGILSVASTSVKDVLDDNGNAKAIGQLSDTAAFAIQSVEVGRDETGTETRKIRLHDKTKALEMAGRTQKMFTDKVEHGGQLGLADLVAASIAPKPEAQQGRMIDDDHHKAR